MHKLWHRVQVVLGGYQEGREDIASLQQAGHLNHDIVVHFKDESFDICFSLSNNPQCPPAQLLLSFDGL